MTEATASARFTPACEECPFVSSEVSGAEACRPPEAELRVAEIAVAVAPCLSRRLVQAEQRLAHTEEVLEDTREQSYHDSLTGLYNYDGFKRVLANIGARRRQEDMSGSEGGTIVFGDAKKFKKLNDDTTHDTADEALIKIANIIAGIVRTSDVVCRRSGDEFIVFIPGSQAVGHIVADRIQKHLNKGVSIEYKGKQHRARVRFGTVHRDIVQGYGDIDAMIQEADALVNKKRRQGK
jgi:diguanylate cyclase (GGDEF)-like protein